MYSRHPSQNGKANILHCYTDGFHPPKITITLLKNGQPMPDVTASDLSFGTDWSFNRLVYAPFTPSSGDEYTCRVEHSALAQPLVVKWGKGIPPWNLLSAPCLSILPQAGVVALCSP